MDGAIHRAAGPKLVEASRAQAPIEAGERAECESKARVVEASAVTGDIGVAALKRVLRHLCDMSDVSASILAPRSIGGVAGEACGASASLP